VHFLQDIKMKKMLSLCEMALLVISTVALSFIINQTNLLENNSLPPTSPSPILEKAIYVLLGNNLVSAQENSGLYTCALNQQGVACQEYPALSCAQQCRVACFPGRRSDFVDCQLGTCMDLTEGTCSSNTPRILCLERGGAFDQRASTEIPFCRKGCCVTGNNGRFLTEQQCNVVREREGVFAEFRPVNNELQCLALGQAQQEGACVLGEIQPNVRFCKRTLGATCQQMRGTFFPGLLCSNTELHTSCRPQVKASCVEGKDEVYWFDSCNNQENIVDHDRREELKAGGRIIPKDQSCTLGTSTNPFANQARCGNCNYLAGSACGSFLTGKGWQQLRLGGADSASVVCRDLSCKDENGNTRKHGESWCAFTSTIGVRGSDNAKRSADVVGSRHYRKVCLNGEVVTEPCQDFRKEICAETRNENAQFSQAACRINQWQLCVNANMQPTLDAVASECLKHTDCYVKNVDLRGGSRDNFAFGLCVPRYPPGFDIQAPSGNDVAETTCSLASQTCTYMKVKGLFSSKKANSNCLTPEFTETMNNLCMSLGDCGAKVNIQGVYTDTGYHTTNAPAPRNAYISALRAYASPIEGQQVEPLSSAEINSILGFPENSEISMDSGGSLEGFALIPGMLGSTLALAVSSGAVVDFLAIDIVNPIRWGLGAQNSILPPVIGAYMSAAAGALVGAAATAFILKATGVGKGLPTEIAIAITLAGAYAGAAIGYGVFSSASGTAFGAAACGTGGGCVVAVIVLAIIAFLSILGIGKKRTVQVEFQCLPWQPPAGGTDCSKCGKNGFPCSRYTCQSLGQTCRFIEESDTGAACVDISPNDVASPVITPNQFSLPASYEYRDVSSLGARVQGPANEGCIPPFERVSIGITTNEYAQCKVDNVHTNSFDQMTHNFHNINGINSNQFRTNHTFTFVLPSNEALQNEADINADANADQEIFDEELVTPHDGQVTLYVRCQDASGNKNTQEYALSFCASPDPDRSAPIMSQFLPSSPGYVALGSSEQRVSFFTNEPAECRWDSQDVDYGLMTHSAECINETSLGTYRGWACTTVLPINSGDESTYYFKCSDQPWLLGNETDGRQRNNNMQSTVYTLRPTTEALRIVSVSPANQTILTQGLPALVNLEVRTEGGAPESARTCSFDWGGSNVTFFETGTDVHRQPRLNLFEARDYTLPIACEDTVGNKALGNIRFTLAIDQQGPAIARVYSLGGLRVVTNENAQCVFSLNSCSFAFFNGTFMQGMEKIHQSPFNSDIAHYVICKDTFNNTGSCLKVRQGKI
jgi:hypothetical protein